MRVLLVEDDPSISASVIKHLTAQHHAVDLCENGNDAFDFIKMTEYDILLMDLMLPGMDGLQVIEKCRKNNIMTPVLILTARDTVADRVIGLDAGADDYLVKPFSLEELSARIRALTRRTAPPDLRDNILTLADLTLNVATQEVYRGNRLIHLTGREYALLEYLMRNKGIVLTRDQIEQKLFNYDYTGASNIVDVYIRYLRKKLDDGETKKLIHTVRRSGYVLREEL